MKLGSEKILLPIDGDSQGTNGTALPNYSFSLQRYPYRSHRSPAVLYLTDINDLRGRTSSLLDVLTDKRRAKALQYRREDDRLRCIAGGLLLRQVLNVTSDEQLTENKFGKPLLKDGTRNFNLSHSGDYVCLVVSDTTVGVDIERIQQPMFDVTEQVLHRDELEYLSRNTLNASEIFYSIWTLKESFVKALGVGLQLDTKSFAILPDTSFLYFFENQSWYFKQYQVYDYIVSVCGHDDNFAAKPTRLFFDMDK